MRIVEWLFLKYSRERENIIGTDLFDYRHSKSWDLTLFFFSCFLIMPNSKKKHHPLTNNNNKNPTLKSRLNEGRTESWRRDWGEKGPWEMTLWWQTTAFSSLPVLYFASHFWQSKKWEHSSPKKWYTFNCTSLTSPGQVENKHKRMNERKGTML